MDKSSTGPVTASATQGAPNATPPIRELPWEGLIHQLREIEVGNASQSIVFLLGAGASITSGIKGAGALAKEWLQEMHHQLHPSGSLPFEAWLTSDHCPIQGLTLKNLAEKYSDIFDAHFGHRPDVARTRLIGEMSRAQPGYGYSVLAQILTQKRHKTVITTNFDHLVEKAMLYFTNDLPLTFTHETTASAIGRMSSVPFLVKCHRDLYLDPISNRSGVRSLHPNYGDALKRILPRNTLLVIGYGGNDPSIMEFLSGLEPRDHPETVYWCYYQPDGPPGPHVTNVLARYRARLVPIDGFNQIMGRLAGMFEFDALDKEMVKHHNARLAHYKQQVDLMTKKGQPDNSGATANATAKGDSTGGPTPPTDNGSGSSEPSTSTPTLPSATLRQDPSSKPSENPAPKAQPKKRKSLSESSWLVRAWNANSDESRERLLLEAIEEHPRSSRLLGTYADFLTDVRKDHDKAQTFYERAIAADPRDTANLGIYANFLAYTLKDHDKAQTYYEGAIAAEPSHATNLGIYANFLTDIRKEHDKAQALYEQAIAADLNHASNLGDYATFLTDIRKEHDKAQAFYEQAIAADANHATNLGNYAIFLTDIRKDYDKAQEFYERAIAADPNNANRLGNYAFFLSNIRKDHDKAQTFYERAIAADPNNANRLGNYAFFLTDIRKDYDKAQEFYERAIAADPNHAHNLGNYTNFLTDIRKDHDKAQTFYERAIAAEPYHAAQLGNYADFLTDIRKDHDKAQEFYERAIAAEPYDTQSLSNYALFLTDIRKDHDKAQKLYERAIAADPNHAYCLGNYTKFLFEHRGTPAGLAMLDRAVAAIDAETAGAQGVETWMYAVCHWLPDKWRDALTKLKPLLVEQKFTTDDWDFSGVIARAKERGHPDGAWLDDLAMVCAGKAEPKSLDGWEAWRKA